MEYDVEIKLTELVKGHGLAKLLAESNCEVLDLHLIVEQSMQGSSTEHDKKQIYNKYLDSLWYGKIVYFMLYLQCPPDLNKNEYRSLKLKALNYVLIDQILYWKYPGSILLKCLDRSEADVVIS